MAVVCKAKVLTIKEHNRDIKEFILKPEKYRRFEAGSFLQLTLDNVSSSDYWPESRTFSMASYFNKEKTIKLVIKRVGKYTTRIFNDLKENSEVTIKYSYGNFLLPIFDKKSDIICVAGGAGITPFFSFIECLATQGNTNRLKLLYSVKYFEDFINLKYLKNILRKNQLRTYTTQEENNDTTNRRICLDDILSISTDICNAHYYICGSKDFNMTFSTQLKNKGIKNVYLDQWE